MTARRRLWLIVGAVVLISLCVVAWIEGGPIVRSYLDLRRQVALFAQPFAPYVQRLRDAGEPVTFAALERPSAPGADNAAGDIEAAWQWVIETAGPEANWTALGPWRADWSETWGATAKTEEIEALRHFLDGVRPFVERTNAALRRAPLRYPMTLDAMGLPKSTWIPLIQSVIRVLVTEAQFARRPEDRLAAISCCLTLGRRLADGGDPTNVMVGGAATRTATNELRRIVEQDSGGASVLRAELNGVLSEQWLPRINGLLRYERVYVIAAYDAALNGGLPPSDDGSPPPSRSDVLRSEFAAIYVCQSETLSRAIAWGPMPHGEWRRRYEALLDETGARSSAFGSILPLKFADTLCRVDAANRLARVALAAAEHRATHGDFPASLDELKPKFPDGLPLDPYTDAPFVYARTATGARISSLGRLPDEAPLDDATLRERVLVWELTR